MRRLTSSAPCRGHLFRFVASQSVLRNVPPAKTSAKIGTAVTKDDIAKAFNVPTVILEQARKPTEIVFVQMDLARSRFAPLIATLSKTEDLTKIAAEVKAKKGTDAAGRQPVEGAKKKLTETAWGSMRELVTFYEEILFPVREKHAEYKTLELASFHVKDDLKRGLSAFKQDQLDKRKAELARLQNLLQECKSFIKTVSESTFNTAIFNDIVNILRICGETNPFAHRMAIQVMEDMSLLGVPFDDVTTKLLHAVAFNDGPFDDSSLIFTLLEYPERGEVSVSKESIEKIADDALQTISKRHQTPLDGGRMLQQNDTHPCLQRSLE